MSVAPRDTVSGHGPEQGVKSRSLLAEEVPCRVMSGGALRNLTIGGWLDRVNQVRELDGILNEEDGNVVSDNVKVALISIAILVSQALKSYILKWEVYNLMANP